MLVVVPSVLPSLDAWVLVFEFPALVSASLRAALRGSSVVFLVAFARVLVPTLISWLLQRGRVTVD